MDVRLSPEQRALRDATAQMADRLGPKAVGQLDDQERIAKLEAAVASTGWRELRIDDDGALLAGGVEVAVVAGELGRALADTPFLGPVLAADLRRLAGLAPAERSETILLDRTMTDLACLPTGQEGTGIAVDTTGAEIALCVTPAPGGHRVAAIAVAGQGADDEPVDLTRGVAAVTGPVGTLDGSGVVSDDALTAWRALGLAASAADLVGLMEGAVDLTTAYATERRQYGTAIGSFQAVQHLLADALVAAEGTRSTALHAAWAVDALDPADALAAAATAKAYASRAARTVCETAIQVHGGIGNTWECLAHIHLRRALLSIDLLGGTSANLDRVLAAHGIEGS